MESFDFSNSSINDESTASARQEKEKKIIKAVSGCSNKGPFKGTLPLPAIIIVNDFGIMMEGIHHEMPSLAGNGGGTTFFTKEEWLKAEGVFVKTGQSPDPYVCMYQLPSHVNSFQSVFTYGCRNEDGAIALGGPGAYAFVVDYNHPLQALKQVNDTLDHHVMSRSSPPLLKMCFWVIGHYNGVSEVDPSFITDDNFVFHQKKMKNKVTIYDRLDVISLNLNSIIGRNPNFKWPWTCTRHEVALLSKRGSGKYEGKVYVLSENREGKVFVLHLLTSVEEMKKEETSRGQAHPRVLDKKKIAYMVAGAWSLFVAAVAVHVIRTCPNHVIPESGSERGTGKNGEENVKRVSPVHRPATVEMTGQETNRQADQRAFDNKKTAYKVARAGWHFVKLALVAVIAHSKLSIDYSNDKPKAIIQCTFAQISIAMPMPQNWIAIPIPQNWIANYVNN